MTWQRTQRHFFAIPADELWAVVGDPTRWPAWSSAVSSFTLEPDEPHEYAGTPVSHAVAVAEAQGPVRAGRKGHYLPSRGWAAALHGRTAGPLEITQSGPGFTLAFTQPAPGGGTQVRWNVQEHASGGCTLEQQITVTGPMTAAIVASIGSDLTADWSLAVTRLYRLLRPAPEAGLLKVVIAGGAGTLGRSIAADLSTRGHDVVLLTRTPNVDLPYRQVAWDGATLGPWTEELAQDPTHTGMINLAGRLVDVRPTAANIADLRDSRVRPTRALVAASQQLSAPLARWIQGSTTAIYSDAGEAQLTESSPVPTGEAALDQMTGVAQPWEQAVEGANAEHLSILRTSIVLQSGSPALDRLTQLTRAGMGGRVGSGKQWFSWIHVQDWLTLIRATLGLEEGVEVPDGILIGAAPHPVRNAELMASLREHLNRPAAPPTPVPLVTIGSLVLRSDPALGLTGRHATSEVLTETGFEFSYPTLDGALRDLMG